MRVSCSDGFKVLPWLAVLGRRWHVVVFVLLLGAVNASADTQGSLRLTVGAGADSNASRDYLQAGVQSDAMLLALVSLQGKWLQEWFVLEGGYDAGGRKFVSVPSEDVIVQAANAEATPRSLLGQ